MGRSPNAWLLGVAVKPGRQLQAQEVSEGGKRPERIARVLGTAWSGSPTAEQAFGVPGRSVRLRESRSVATGSSVTSRGPVALSLFPHLSEVFTAGLVLKLDAWNKGSGPSFMEYPPCARFCTRCCARCPRTHWGQNVLGFLELMF